MNWCKHSIIVSLLLAMALSHVVTSQEEDQEDPSEVSEPIQSLDEEAAEPEPDGEPVVAQAPEEDPGDGQMVGQSLFQPRLGQGLGQGPLSVISWMFPALNALLMWGNLFPTSSLLGAPPEEQAAAASKVVLVLAEDRDPQVGAATEDSSRNIRQNDFLSQLLQTLGQGLGQLDLSQNPGQTLQQYQQLLQQALPQDLSQNAGQFLSQALQQTGQIDLSQGPGQILQPYQQLLQQIVPPELSQNAGQFLSQTLQQLPGLPTLSQPQSTDSVVGAALDEAAEAPADAPAPTPPTPSGFNFPQNIQSAIDSGNAMLGQALGQGNPDGSSGLFNIQSAIDSGNAMLGQALGQGNPDGGSGLFNIQSAIDNGGAMLGQALGQGNPADGGGGLFNFKSFQPWPQAIPPIDSNPIEAAASQVSEVRVKPDTPLQSSSPHIPQVSMPTASHTFSENPTQHLSHTTVQSTMQNPPKFSTSQKMAELKLKAALHEALGKKPIPILWFRIPSQTQTYNYRKDVGQRAGGIKSAEDLQIESKLQAFERQVIAELKQLQAIERQANEMRAAAKGLAAKTNKESPYKLNYPLSKTPVHKITREDIEKALSDEYVKKLLMKTIQHGAKDAKQVKASISTTTSAPIKRQTMMSDPNMRIKQLSRDDIVKMMAYAYRMSNDNGRQMLQMDTPKKNDGTVPWTLEQMSKPNQRQWADPQTQPTSEQKTLQQMPIMMPTQRQWAEDQTKAQQQIPMQPREWVAQQNMPQNMAERQWLEQKMQQAPDQRETVNEGMKQQQPQTPEQRQWFDMQSMEQRRWPDDQMNEQRAPMEQRQWAEQQMVPQMPMQRQWADEKSSMKEQHAPMEQRQWAEQQMVPQMPMQRQWADEKSSMKEQHAPMEQRQWAEQQMIPQMPMQRQWADEKSSMKEQHTPEQRQMSTMIQNPTMPEQRQWVDPKATEMQTQMPTQMQMQQRHFSEPPPSASPILQDDPMMMQMPQEQARPQIPFVAEATPQSPETDGKARHKGGDLFDEFDLFGVGGGGDKKGKGKKGGHAVLRPTIINYYYTQGGSRYPAYGGYPTGGYGVGGGYGAGYGYGGASAYGGGAGYGSASGYGGTSAYGGGGGYASSGGYGGAGAYGSSGGYGGGGAYRTAVGSDEIDAMLKEHATAQKIVPEAAHVQPATPSQLPDQPTIRQPNINANPDHMSVQTITATFSKDEDKQPSTQASSSSSSSASTSTSTLETGNMARLDNKLRFNGVVDVRKRSENTVRQKRNVNYGSLQPIDEKSLNDLRKTYKESLKEITLKPDEDPAEALMRYNAASIRDALERANQEPLEIGSDAGEEVHAHNPFYKGAHLQSGGHGYDGHVETVVEDYGNYVGDNNRASTLHHHSHHQHHQDHHHLPQNRILSNKINQKNKNSMIYRTPPHNLLHEHSQLSLQPQVPQQHHPYPHLYQRHTAYANRLNYNSGHGYDSSYGLARQYATEDLHQSTQHTPIGVLSKPIKSLESVTGVHNQPLKNPLAEKSGSYNTETAEPDLAVVLKVIKERLSNCCEKCKDRILTGIKENNTSKEVDEQEKRKVTKNAYESNVKKMSYVETASAKAKHISDEEHEQWLNEMASRGYERKYLTKAHQWEYLHSGKLSLVMQSDEDFGNNLSDDSLADQTNDQSYKRDTPRQPYTSPGKHSDASRQRSAGKKFQPKTRESGFLMKEQVHAVNAELQTSKEYFDETTPSPYALRGKFMRSNFGMSGVTSAVPQPVKFDRLAEQSTQQVATTPGNGLSQRLLHAVVESQGKAAVEENTAKVVELLNLLYDLKPAAGAANVKPTQHILPIAGTTTENAEASISTSTMRPRTKRLRSRHRRPKTQGAAATQLDQSAGGKRTRSVN